MGLSRRDALRAAGLSGLVLGLSACGRFGGGGEGDGKTVLLNFVWWGDTDRAKKTQAALDIFQKQNPGITVKTEFQDAFPYRDKLNTRFAAGDPPDVMAMRNDSISEYASRGALLDLTRDNVVDLSGINDAARALGTVNGKVAGVPAGLNAPSFVINTAATEQLGVQLPDGDTWSWDDLAAFSREVTKASGRKVYGTTFEVWNVGNLVLFAAQQGEAFFTPDGQLGVTQATIAAWLAMVEKMRAEGGFPPAGFNDPTLGSSPEKSYLALGKVASQVVPSNQFQSFSAAVPGHQLVILEFPGETTERHRGTTLGCPHLWAVAAKSKHPKESLLLVNFLLNNVDGAKATGTTRGVPASSTVTEAIKSTLSPEDQVATDYILGVLEHEDLPSPPAFPPGSAKLNPIMQTLASEVEFKKKTPDQAAAEYITQARKALAG